jgi:hypothetical protein
MPIKNAVPECRPPEGTDDFTMHWLSREVGDGSHRERFEALWTGGMWETKGIWPLSPRKAAWATWQYEGKSEDHNWHQLLHLLRDHINQHMDQSERWTLKDSLGNPVYITISYKGDGYHYDDLDAAP